MYYDELKNKLLKNLIKKYDFPLPKSIIEKEMDDLANQKVKELSEDELKAIQGDEKKIGELRESVREDAINSVKATLIIDAMAKAENITVSDDEVYQLIYYEAINNGKSIKELLDLYRKNNLLPVIRMGLVEDKLFLKLFGFDKPDIVEESVKSLNK